MNRPCSNSASHSGQRSASIESKLSAPHGRGIPHFGQADGAFSGSDPTSAGLLSRKVQIGEWQRVQTISSPVRPSDSNTDFSYSSTALQSRQYTNFVAVESALSKISGSTSFARCSTKPFIVLMALLQAGQPGTTTPFPPLAIDGGLSTKCSQEWRFNSRCEVATID